jgi:hypothetical protein
MSEHLRMNIDTRTKLERRTHALWLLFLNYYGSFIRKQADLSRHRGIKWIIKGGLGLEGKENKRATAWSWPWEMFRARPTFLGILYLHQETWRSEKNQGWKERSARGVMSGKGRAPAVHAQFKWRGIGRREIGMGPWEVERLMMEGRWPGCWWIMDISEE